jgi:hypothetical protein
MITDTEKVKLMLTHKTMEHNNNILVGMNWKETKGCIECYFCGDWAVKDPFQICKHIRNCGEMDGIIWKKL